MQKKYLIILVVLVLIAASVFWFIYARGQTKNKSTLQTSEMSVDDLIAEDAKSPVYYPPIDVKGEVSSPDNQQFNGWVDVAGQHLRILNGNFTIKKVGAGVYTIKVTDSSGTIKKTEQQFVQLLPDQDITFIDISN